MINVSYCYGVVTMMLNTLHTPHLIHVITLSDRDYFHIMDEKAEA